MAAKKTIGQKKVERQANERAAKAASSASRVGASRVDKLVSQLNTMLGGIGRVSTADRYLNRGYDRRPSGVPDLDYVMGGGYPKGAIVQLVAQYSVGKSTLSYHAIAEAQRREPHKANAVVALEPFSKTWARENGVWLPFSEEPDARGEPMDSFERATETEKARMAQLGIEDPYSWNGLGEVIVVQEERGDVALDAALAIVKSNLCAIVLVDSLGIAKSTKWVEENEVQDAGDFPREAKMIGDYTTRVCLALNARYDENNQKASDGQYRNETTCIHLNHVTTVIGTMARAQHNKFEAKGGEGNKHNNHISLFLWRGEMFQTKVPGNDRLVYAQEVKVIAKKNKTCEPFREGCFTLYLKSFNGFLKGDVDIGASAATYGVMSGVIEQKGAWYTIGEDWRFQGRDQLARELNENTELREWVLEASSEVLNGK